MRLFLFEAGSQIVVVRAESPESAAAILRADFPGAPPADVAPVELDPDGEAGVVADLTR